MLTISDSILQTLKSHMHRSRKSKLSCHCLQLQSASNSLSVFTFYTSILKKPCATARCHYIVITSNLWANNCCTIIVSLSRGVKQKLVSIFQSLFHLIMAVTTKVLICKSCCELFLLVQLTIRCVFLAYFDQKVTL